MSCPDQAAGDLEAVEVVVVGREWSDGRRGEGCDRVRWRKAVQGRVLERSL